ncbi:conserved hypothetical protein [Chitinophaga pinensis DSM 2588]|uniref:Uncharacterized protein n=2 Tax=Chitinophaga pinensis TaxID=79329 RepID=A0A979GBK0_CHIPD|nr:conserved hypothetical protein [Chitinophaga pinensis DSM 2588]
MNMKRLFLGMTFFLSLVFSDIFAQQSAKQMREGTHNFTLQWISWDKPGKVQIKKQKDGTYTVKGEQLGEDGDFVTIDGMLTVVTFAEMTFTGKIQSRYANINKGEVCDKTGTYHFLAKGARKYWRLQEMDNCEGNNVVDYVDIYF